MKYLFCLYKYFPYGGLQRDFLKIATACAARGHKIQVLTLEWQGEKPKNFDITIVESRHRSNHKRYAELSSHVLTRIIMENIDCVIGFDKIPGIDIYYAADPCYREKMSKRKFWHRLTPRYRKLAHFEGHIMHEGSRSQILTLSPEHAIVFNKHYGKDTHDFHLLPPGIEQQHCVSKNPKKSAQRIRDEFQLGDKKILLMVGSGFKAKGVDRALLALASLPNELKHNSQLLIIGQDNPNTYIQQAKQLNLTEQVKFLGGRDDVADFYSAADLLLHPAYHEAAGIVLLEAIVAGLPILVSNTCGYSHYISDAQAGLVLPEPYSQQTCNQYLHKLLTQDNQQFRDNALAFSKNNDLYSMPEHAAKLIDTMAPGFTHEFSIG